MKSRPAKQQMSLGKKITKLIVINIILKLLEFYLFNWGAHTTIWVSLRTNYGRHALFPLRGPLILISNHLSLHTLHHLSSRWIVVFCEHVVQETLRLWKYIYLTVKMVPPLQGTYSLMGLHGSCNETASMVGLDKESQCAFHSGYIFSLFWVLPQLSIKHLVV